MPKTYLSFLVRNPFFKVWNAEAQPAGYPDQIVEKYGLQISDEVTQVERGAADEVFDGDVIPADRLNELISGRKPPRGAMPTGMLKLMAPAGPLVGKVMGQPPNLRELISSADGVTFWAKHDKAMAELGYSPRGLETGLRETLEAEGKL